MAASAGSVGWRMGESSTGLALSPSECIRKPALGTIEYLDA
jgi:hypothetical protein